MNQYYKVLVATEKNVSEYLSNGWEIIDTTKSSYDGLGNDTDLNYHLGYPFKKYCEDLLAVVRLYEDNDFKEQLFSKIALDGGEDLDKFTINGGIGLSTKNTVINIIKNYEQVVNNKDVTFYHKVNLKPDEEFSF